MAKQFKIAHFARFSPNQCGLYHTVKDLVWGEQQIGIDARFIDSYFEDDKTFCGQIKEDGWLTTGSSDWAKEADILVSHTYIPKEFKEIGKPIIIMIHGRPENTYLMESYGIMGTWSSYYSRARNDQYKAFVSFWPELMPIYEQMVPKEKLYCITAPVNLKDFTIEGPKFDFGKGSGSPNIIVADVWREDVTPFNVIMAGNLFKKKYCPTAKLQVFGMHKVSKNHNKVLVLALQKNDSLGCVAGIIRRIADVYRAGDILITPHIIATRVIREALACGLSIVAGQGCKYANFTADPRNTEKFAEEINKCWKANQSKESNRKIAEEHFNPMNSARTILPIFQKVIQEPVVIDLSNRKENISERVDIVYKDNIDFSKLDINQKNHYRRYEYAQSIINLGKVIGDFACGTGYGSILLSKKSSNVIGVDIDKEVIEHIKVRYKDVQNVKFLCANLLNLKCKPLLDYIVSFETIEHLNEDDIPKLFAVFNNALKPGGRLIFSAPYMQKKVPRVIKGFHLTYEIDEAKIQRWLSKNGFVDDFFKYQDLQKCNVQDSVSKKDYIICIAHKRQELNDSKKRLDVGCADFKREGWIGMDIRKVKGVDVVHDAQIFPWPFEDNYFDEVLMSHLYEHIEPKYRVQLIDEAWRILKPTGQLYLISPSANTFRSGIHPGHYVCPNMGTFAFFDPKKNPYFNHNEGKPWKLIVNEQWRNGDLLVQMEPRK